MSWEIEGAKCLLCLDNRTNSLSLAFPSFPGTGTATPLPELGVHLLQQDEAEDQLNQSFLSSHLWSIFLLRKFLQFPEEECHSILQKTFGGVHPGSWFSLCDQCSELVQNACQLHVQISKLQRQVELLREVAFEKLKGSFKELPEEDASSRIYLSVEGMIRDYYRQRFDPLGDGDGDLQKQNSPKDDHAQNVEIVHYRNDFNMEQDEYVEYCSEPGSESEQDGDSDPDFALEQDEEGQQVEDEADKPSTSNSQLISDSDDADEDDEDEGNAIEISSAKQERRSTAEMRARIGENKYKCRICNEVIEGKAKWIRHMATHSTCHICGYKNKRKEKLANHMRAHKIEDSMIPTSTSTKGTRVTKRNRNKTQFACKLCTFRGYRRLVYSHISSTHFASETFPCPLCPKRFTQTTHVRGHVRAAHGIHGDFKCHCRKWFLTPECLKKHQQTQHANEVFPKKRIRKRKPPKSRITPKVEGDDGKEYKCDKCTQTIEGTKTFEKHMQQHRTTCWQCGYHHENHENVERHVRTHKITDNIIKVAHPPSTIGPSPTDSSSQYSCKLCGFLGTKPVVYMHVSVVHFGGATLQCDICSKTFTSKVSLRCHVREVHEKSYCDQCPMIFAKQKDFQDHLEWHSNGGFLTNLCEKCGKGFSTGRALTKHRKALNCGFDKAGTPKRKNRIEFMDQGNGSQCGFCDKKVFSRKGLTAHCKEEHPEQFKYKCDLCEDNVLYMCHKNLKSHMERVHSLTEFKCPNEECGYVSTTSRQLRRHLIVSKMGCGGSSIGGEVPKTESAEDEKSLMMNSF